jgi:hypothetical protein
LAGIRHYPIFDTVRDIPLIRDIPTHFKQDGLSLLFQNNRFLVGQNSLRAEGLGCVVIHADWLNGKSI